MKFAAFLLLAHTASASTIITGMIEAGWSWPDDGGISVSISGSGISAGALIDGGTGSGMLNCTACRIAVSTMAGGPSRGTAVIGNQSSDVFSLALATSGNGQWTGTLSLFDGVDVFFHDPFATADLTATSVPSVATWFTPDLDGVREFVFSDPAPIPDPNATAGGGAVAIDSPEPSAFLPIGVLLLYRQRSRRQSRSTRRLVHPRQ